MKVEPRRKSVDVSARVNALLERRGWSVFDLSQRLGVSETAVRSWRSGKAKMHPLRLSALEHLETEER